MSLCIILAYMYSAYAIETVRSRLVEYVTDMFVVLIWLPLSMECQTSGSWLGVLVTTFFFRKHFKIFHFA